MADFEDLVLQAVYSDIVMVHQLVCQKGSFTGSQKNTGMPVIKLMELTMLSAAIEAVQFSASFVVSLFAS